MKSIRIFIGLFSFATYFLLSGAFSYDQTDCKQVIISNSGVTLWYNQPSAVYFEGKYKRTYFSWVTREGSIQIRFYDHNDKTLSKITTIHNWDKQDDHGAPSIIVRTEGEYKGRIIITYSLHSSPMMERHSMVSENIDSWSDERTIYEGPSTYPRLVELNNGKIILVFRSHPLVEAAKSGWLSFIESNNSGESWSEAIKIVDFGINSFVYAGPIEVSSDKIGIAWSIYDTVTKRFKSEIFAAYTDDTLNGWKSLNDKEIFYNAIDKSITPIATVDDKKQGRVWDMAFANEKNDLKVSYIGYDGDYGCCFNNDMVGYISQFSNKQWNVQKTGQIADMYYPGGLVFNKGEEGGFYSGVENKSRGAIKVNTLEQSSWFITSDEYLFGLTRPQGVKNASSEIPITFLGINTYDKFNKFDTVLIALICEE